MASYQIDNYAVRMWSSRPTTNLNPGVAVAGIYLYEGATYRGYVYFFPDGTQLAPPVIDAANGRISSTSTCHSCMPCCSWCGRRSRCTSTSSARRTSV